MMLHRCMNTEQLILGASGGAIAIAGPDGTSPLGVCREKGDMRLSPHWSKA